MLPLDNCGRCGRIVCADPRSTDSTVDAFLLTAMLAVPTILIIVAASGR